MKKINLIVIFSIALLSSCTDKRDSHLEENKFKSCIGIVTEILTSSPTFRKRTKGLYAAVVKNGGSSYGIALEGSPDPKNDTAWNYSKTYDFNLHESYPDRMVVTGRFSFDPHRRRLYEYDVVNDTLIPIEFDKSLLAKFDEACK